MRNSVRLLCVAAAVAVLASSLALAAKSHEVKGEFVSADMEAKTVTFKNEKGESVTVPYLPEATDSLKAVKAGDKVILTCADDDHGQHQGVSAVKLEKKERTA
jgi:hypothetical protein